MTELLMLVPVLWLLVGIPALEERASRRAAERAEARKREWDELDEAIDELRHWQRFGRGQPYRDPVDLAKVMRGMGYDEQTISWLLAPAPAPAIPRMRDLLPWKLRRSVVGGDGR